MSYEKDKLDSYITSASLATALGPYITSASVSSAIAGINLAPYMTSNSISLAVTTNTLTVRGAASVSATMSAAAVTVAGRPVGAVLLGTVSGSNRASVAFSGSWSDFSILELHTYVTAGGGTTPISIFTDGGTTAILSTPLNAAITVPRSFVYRASIVGNGTAFKLIDGLARDEFPSFYQGMTSTANSGFINCLRLSLTNTASVVFSALYGWRST